MTGAALDTAWSPDPGLLLSLSLLLGAYLVRWRRVRDRHGPAAASGWRMAAFAGGVAALVAALVSPLDRMAEQLATLHMVQHLLLLDLAPILLLAGTTKILLRPVTRALVPVERAAGPLAHPAMGAIAYVGAMVAYHAPPVYDLTLRSDLAHVLAHMALAGAGALYWWHLLSPARQRLRMGILGPVAYMAATKVGAGLVAIALGFAPELIYDSYARLPEVWGLTHLEDQRAAGLLMALEQSLVMGIALVALFVRAMENAEQADRRTERLAQAQMVTRAHGNRAAHGRP